MVWGLGWENIYISVSTLGNEGGGEWRWGVVKGGQAIEQANCLGECVRDGGPFSQFDDSSPKAGQSFAFFLRHRTQNGCLGSKRLTH